MRFEKDILSDVLRDMEKEREERARLLETRRQKIYKEIPRVRQIETTLQSTAAAVLRAALESGEDPSASIARLRERNLSLQDERARLLTAAGYPSDFLTDAPKCAACGDSGYVGTQPCECLKRRYAVRQAQQLSSILPIFDQTFENFDLRYYPDAKDARLGISPRENMNYNLQTCRKYAYNFGEKAENLFLYGSTGLGKTYLSACIAGVVSKRGFSVAYDTTIHVLSCYENLKFGNADTDAAAQAVRRFEHSDLLILDDLGTEMSTQFSVTTLYSLINTRLMTRRPIIINTNLLPIDLEERYSPAIASRIMGDFTHLRFLGSDIRLIKKREKRFAE